ncbi:MAG: hypothetical protein ACI8YQ_000638 [Polaribacter sp.]
MIFGRLASVDDIKAVFQSDKTIMKTNILEFKSTMNKLTTISKFIAILLLVNLSITSSTAQQIYINEFLASNSNVNVDEYDENDDWVELYNSSSSSVNIGGMFFTDDLINTTKWMIPNGTTISGNGYLLIWCDNQDSQGALHTNFKLSSGGESIALVAGDGTTIIDSYIYGPQTANTSQGRETDGGSPWTFFAQPTPDETNNAGTSVAAIPVASQNGGHYNSDITITLTTTTPGGTIRYTLDGSEPTSSSSSYSSSLDIDETTVLRARTFKPGMEPSRTMTHTYLYGIDHTMPIFCVSTDDDNFFGDNGIYTLWDDDIEVPCHVELYETDGTFGFRQDLGVQVHGGFSQSYPHKGISFVAKNQYVNNKISYPLFPNLPFDEYGSFILRASGNDWSKLLFRDALGANIVNDISDVDSLIQDPDLEFQGYRPAIVYLNGEYFGIHNLREKLDWRYLKTHYDIEKEDADIVQRRDGLEHGNLDAWTIYRDFIEDADFTDPADLEEMKTWIDLDHFVDYFLHNVFIDNNDWPDNNNKGWRLREGGGRWRYFLYDMDRGFGLIPLGGNYNSGDWTSANLEMVMAPTQTEDHNKEWSTLQLRKLMENDGFRLKFINRMADLLNIMYTPDRLLGRINAFEDVYEPEIDEHADKWWDSNYYATNVNRSRIFAENRTAEVWDQFEDFFDIVTGQADLELNAQPQAGGIIHLNTMNFREENFPWIGKYFEGVDVPLRAQPNPGYFFSGWTPSSLGNNAITIMNLTGNEEVTANFILGSTQIATIVINEINYHSPDTAICDAGDWIELFNPGNDAVDVSGWFLEDGSGNYFNIPANTIIGGQGYLVLVEDEVRFQLLHPTITNFVGGFGQSSLTGNMGLSNGGEWISINNANRTFIDSLHYDDKLPWPESPDGDGPTLQLITPTLDNALASSWVPSQDIKGTPGAPNQGFLYLGENTFLCTAQTLSLDASYEPCFGCTYQWNTGATTTTINVSPNPGTNNYTVTVTDLGGATQTDEITIDLSSPFNLSYSQQSLICADDTNGIIDLSVNGIGSYTYQWTNGATSQDIYNLTVGTYTVTVSDALFCTQTEEVTISAPTPLVSSAAETEINCYGELASIDISISGGASPFTYNWSNGATSQDLNDLSQGTYALTITDMNSCTNTLDFSYSEPTEITGDFDIEHGCNGLNNGNIDVDMEGGAGGYYYEWSNGAASNSDDLTDIGVGIYNLTVSDNSGCTWVNSVEILASTSMSGNATITNTPCSGDNTGSIDFSLNGGNFPYVFNWDNGATSASIQNLTAGPYEITVTDSTGCQFYDSLYVSAPEPVFAEADINSISCFGASDASINILAAGGNGTYNYAWSTGGTNSSISNLSNGNYNLTITDGMGCSANFVYILDEPAVLTAATQASFIDCNGTASGSVNTITQGGTSPYSYSWSNGETTDSITNVMANTYTVTISDANNCSSVETATVFQNTAVTNSVNQINLDCNSNNTGSISINTTGGSGSYTYLWDDGQTTAQLNNLAAETYNLTVTDNNNCTSTESIIITAPPAMEVSMIQSDVSCFGANQGNLIANPSGGVGPYSFSWNTGATTNETTNLAAADYTVTITDNNNCSFVQTSSITQPDIISSTFSNVDITCNGMNHGEISLSVEGGTGDHSFLWSNGEIEESINNLEAGTYEVTISDMAGCSIVQQANITEPNALSSNYQIESVDCHDNQTGSISLNTSGGTGDYSYLWNTGGEDNELINITAGTYNVTISDAEDCTLVESIELLNPSPLVGTIGQTNLSCFGDSNGDITLSTTGGSSPYEFDWSNNEDSDYIDNLVSGEYVVTINDNNDCTSIANATISSPDLIEANIETIAVDCSGSSNALIDLSPNGGSGNYSFEWNTGATSTDLNNIPEGNYSVTITDTNDCSIVENVLVSEPSPIALQFENENLTCFGTPNGFAEVTVNGGEAPYEYLWNTGSTADDTDNLPAGSYTVTVTDMNGCTKIEETEITEPDALIIENLTVTDNSCYGSSSGSISIEATGGTGATNFEWNNGTQESDNNNLAAGTYELTITDANNCTLSETFVINQPTEIQVSPNVQDVDCFDQSNGAIDLAITGGIGDYTFNWNTGVSTQNLDNLSPGEYIVTVTDDNNCSMVEILTVTQPSLLSVQQSSVPPNCFGESNGQINLSPSGGETPYTFLWNTGSTSEVLSDLAAGSYSYTLTDNNGCTSTQTIGLNEPTLLTYNNFQLIDNNCFAGSNGMIALNATGGNGNYTYEWNNGNETNSINGLIAGEYIVTVTDGNNCSFSESFVITEPTAVIVTSTIGSIQCNDDANGSIEISISGGTGAYTSNWNTGDAGLLLENLQQGVYTVTVTDELACSSVQTITLNQPTSIAVIPTVVAPACNGFSDGTISLFVEGGTLPFTYLWDNDHDGPNPTDLGAGDYIVTITDANNCSYTQTVSVSEPSSLEATYEVLDNICFGEMNGSVSTTPTGGIIPYTYNWSTGDSTSTIDELSAADYTLTITDGNDCISEETIAVTEASMLESNTTIQDVGCFGNSDGAIEMELVGGTPEYQIEWEDGSTFPTTGSLSVGNYSVTVVDMAGCESVFTHIVNEPEELTTLEVIMNITDSNNGSITITPQGGIPGYSIEWEDGTTSFSLTDLESGVYNYIVTDENGCLVEGSVSLINVGISAISENELFIYPNPTSGVINVEADFMAVEILVYDVLGLLLKQESIAGGEKRFSVDLTGFSSGVYFLKVKADDRERVERIVVGR